MSTASTAQTDTQAIEFTVAPQNLAEVSGVAETILNESLASCASQLGLGSREAVVSGLQQNNEATMREFQYSLGKNAARQLGSLDENIRKAYVYMYEATTDDVNFGRISSNFMVHMIVWVGRKTGALRALAVALDRALADAYAETTGTPQKRHLLDIQMVDDDDMERGLGYAALIGSLQNPPLLLWERSRK
jgi:hypothetical protein